MLSARNILNAKISKITSNEVSSFIETRLENDKPFKALITTSSVHNLELKEGQNVLMIFKAGAVIIAKNECRVRTSSANELSGKIIDIKPGSVHALITADCSGVQIHASITMASLERMQLKTGDDVVMQIKATGVMVGIEE